MNNDMSCNFSGRLEADKFIQMINKSIRDSQIYFPDSYYYEDLISNTNRFERLVEQIRLIALSRTFDIEKVNRLYETHQDLLINAIEHKNEDLYFDAIYSMFDSLSTKLIEISKSECYDRHMENKVSCENVSNINNLYFLEMTPATMTDVIFFDLC